MSAKKKPAKTKSAKPADDCDSGSQTMDKTPGLVSWNELYTNDRGASVKFYTKLFGWKTQDMDMGGFTYTILQNPGGKGVAGLFEPSAGAGGPPPMWMGYVTVPNLKSAVTKAKKLGAKICKDITKIPMGSFAIIADPQGATIGMWEFAE